MPDMTTGFRTEFMPGEFEEPTIEEFETTGFRPRRKNVSFAVANRNQLAICRLSKGQLSAFINRCVDLHENPDMPKWKLTKQLIQGVKEAAETLHVSPDAFVAMTLSEASRRVIRTRPAAQGEAKDDGYYESVAYFVSFHCDQTLTSGDGSYASRLFSVFSEYQRQRSADPGNPQRFGMALAGLNLLKSRTTDGFMYNLIVKRELIEELGIE